LIFQKLKNKNFIRKMDWKENLAKIINDSDFSDREIHAWTNISTSVISNMSNQKHESFKAEQFIRLKLLLNKNYEDFVYEIFGKEHFSEVIKIEKHASLTPIGRILTDKYRLEVVSKKELCKATGISSHRITYILENEDETIKIDELTKIELALGLTVGTISSKRFSNIKLNSRKQYETILKKLRDV